MLRKPKQFEILLRKTEKVVHDTLFAMINIAESYHITLFFVDIAISLILLWWCFLFTYESPGKR